MNNENCDCDCDCESNNSKENCHDCEVLKEIKIVKDMIAHNARPEIKEEKYISYFESQKYGGPRYDPVSYAMWSMERIIERKYIKSEKIREKITKELNELKEVYEDSIKKFKNFDFAKESILRQKPVFGKSVEEQITEIKKSINFH